MPTIKKQIPCPNRCKDIHCKRNRFIELREKPIIWLLGGPGVGKGTQSAKIVERYGVSHISAGDLLRADIEKGTKRAKMLVETIARGELVPTSIVLELLLQAIEENAPRSNGFLIDGYPRDESQGIAFVDAIAPATAIIYLQASKETLEQRLLGRALTSGRVDDNEEKIKARIRTFLENNDKIINRYSEGLVTVNAERDVDSVFEDIKNALDKLLPDLPRRSRTFSLRHTTSIKSFTRLSRGNSGYFQTRLN